MRDGQTSSKLQITDDLPVEFSRGSIRISRFPNDEIEFYTESADGTLTKLSLVPYWVVVIPLTTFSADLLFVKPRYKTEESC